VKKKRIVVGSTAVALLGLLAAGCGSASDNSGVASVGSASSTGAQRLRPASSSDAAAAVKASRCMRSHGVPKFPDPILGGHFGFMVGSGIDPDTPQFKAAYSYCGKRYLHYHPLQPAELARRNVAAVKYSACMRSRGASDFPDPDGQGAINLPSDDYIHTMAHQELGMRVLERVRDDLIELCQVEAMPKLEGRQMVMVLAPKKKAAPHKQGDSAS
jgi:hypothetical protein